MKKIYLLFSLVIAINTVHAQSWCTPGSTWYYGVNYPSSGYVKFTYLYDTLVGSDMCNKIRAESHVVFSPGSGQNDHTSYIYTKFQNGIVYKNNGTLSVPHYDTLYNFTGAVGAKWRTNPTSGQACARSFIEITGGGSMQIQGQTINYKTISYTNYYYINGQYTIPQTGIDTLFERIGTRHQMEFITGFNCADITDVGPVPFRCFSDNQISIQSSSTPCDYITGIRQNQKQDKGLVVASPSDEWIKGSFNAERYELKLYDVLGKPVYQAEVDQPEFRIAAGNLANGVYFISIKYRDETISKKILIAH